MRGSLLRWTKFTAVSSLGMMVHLILLALLIKVFGMHYLPATTLAVEAAVLHNFVWHREWTWADRLASGRKALVATLLRFHASNGLVSVAGNLFFMKLFAGVMRFDPLLACLLCIPPCALVNFVASDRLVFLPNQSRADSGQQQTGKRGTIAVARNRSRILHFDIQQTGPLRGFENSSPASPAWAESALPTQATRALMKQSGLVARRRPTGWPGARVASDCSRKP